MDDLTRALRVSFPLRDAPRPQGRDFYQFPYFVRGETYDAVALDLRLRIRAHMVVTRHTTVWNVTVERSREDPDLLLCSYFM